MITSFPKGCVLGDEKVRNEHICTQYTAHVMGGDRRGECRGWERGEARDDSP